MTTNKLNKDARINFLDIEGRIFEKYIYPMSANDFLTCERFDDYFKILNAKVVLNDDQWEEVLMHWHKKRNRFGRK